MRINIEFEGNESSSDFLEYLMNKKIKARDYANHFNDAKFDLELKGCFPITIDQTIEPLEFSCHGFKYLQPQPPKVKIELNGDFVVVKDENLQQESNDKKKDVWEIKW